MVAENNFTERLKAIRAKSARLRCEAFVDYRPTVCGLILNPVTLASYNHLLAFDNAFATGAPVKAADVLVWVWVHHRDFGQRAESAKQQVFAHVWRSLRPVLPNFNAFVHLVAPVLRWRWLARLRVKTERERHDEAVELIRHLMAEALYGFPPAEDDETQRIDAEEREFERKEKERATGKAIPRAPERFEPGASVAFQAQILNAFRREYGMTYAETESLPLKKLSQLWREHLFAHSTDKTGLKLMDREEAALWAEQMQPEGATNG